MSTGDESVLPETAPKIESARRVPGFEWTAPYRNIGEALAQNVLTKPDKNYLTYCDDGQATRWSYAKFQQTTYRLAALLRSEMHIDVGDRVATLSVNDPRTVFIYFAAWLIGAVVVPINCTEDDDRINFILDNANVKALFIASDQIARLRKVNLGEPNANDVSLSPGYSLLGPQPGADGQHTAADSALSPLSLVLGPESDGINRPEHVVEVDALNGVFDSMVASRPLLETLPNVTPDTECLIVYTSGTTGAPKGVVLEQQNLLADAQSIAEWHRFGPEDRAMCVLPIHHVNGTVVTLVTPMFTGGSVVLNRKFHAGSFWQTLASERCTWVSVVPTVLAFLCERKTDLTELDLSVFRHIICGAGPLTVEMAHRFEEAFGVRVVHGYGLSETTCYSCFLPIDLAPKEYHHWMFECGFPSIGCPISANEMAIHDGEGRSLPPDVRGEIVARGYNVMRWYFRRPDANLDAFAHGWFRSGDEGFYRVGPDGRDYYFITGRLKELFIRGGVNYSPFDIDEVLVAIPGVKAAMAVGFENNFYGEEIGAFVQLEDGATLTADEIVKACRKELPYPKSPKVVLFGTEFPVTSTGKYQRNKLKPLFAQWKNSLFREAK